MIQSGKFDSSNMDIKKLANSIIIFIIKRLIENIDMNKEMMISLSFDLINKINKSVIILYSKESNNLNILCNVSKTLNDYEFPQLS